ncbi:MAG: low molecular weight phosphotyrosine protein phosphatase [Rhodospirillales bacterium]|nr:low molecular weight phosphotyrosine protein phosphatase [Rhodospirillales bacterium]MCW8862886.1 low molecular weight phosphotyrosine protein phosphatase [Rhodospirillales bacterium]MCW8971097.1 low molecular weight phosphotyrosine protein phosphatase [Rhodospirillales bacterium]
MVKVLFVCLGNICRSPTAEGVFRAMVHREGLSDRITIDSAGTAAWHVGKSPDPRSMAAARARGIDMSAQRARQAVAGDFAHFDYVLAMDSENHADLLRLCPRGAEGKLSLFLDFAPHLGRRDVPDPYYGGPGGFDEVLDLVEAAAEGLLADIRQRHL